MLLVLSKPSAGAYLCLSGLSWRLWLGISKISKGLTRHGSMFTEDSKCWALLAGHGRGTGIFLGAMSPVIEYKGHRCIGITLFVLACIQLAVAFSLRPKKTDKRRGSSGFVSLCGRIRHNHHECHQHNERIQHLRAA